MDATVDLISIIQQLDGKFAAREQQVADYVLENLEVSVHANLAEIADSAHVSHATVNRFCQTIGCDGFKDFKIKLAQNVAVSIQYLASDQSRPNTAMPDGLVTQVFGTLIETLNNISTQYDPAILEKAIDTLVTAKRIVFLGVGGGSSNVAREGVNRFFRLGIPCEAHSDGYFQRMLASTLEPGDVIFTISQSGSPKELLDATSIAKQYGAKSIALTRPSSKLAKLVDIAIEIAVPENQDIYKPTASRIVYIATLDILATGVARRQPEKTKEKLRRIRSALVTMENEIRPRPIGD